MVAARQAISEVINCSEHELRVWHNELVCKTFEHVGELSPEEAEEVAADGLMMRAWEEWITTSVELPRGTEGDALNYLCWPRIIGRISPRAQSWRAQRTHCQHA